jgi:hypothetical protein
VQVCGEVVDDEIVGDERLGEHDLEVVEEMRRRAVENDAKKEKDCEICMRSEELSSGGRNVTTRW